MASIGEQIVAARKAKGMTQDALAKALNISRATISNYETDRRLPDARTLLKLSRALEYSFEDETEALPEAEALAAEVEANAVGPDEADALRDEAEVSPAAGVFVAPTEDEADDSQADAKASSAAEAPAAEAEADASWPDKAVDSRAGTDASMAAEATLPRGGTAAPVKARRVAIWAAAAVMVCVCVAVAVIRGGASKANDYVAADGTRYTVEQFQRQTPREDGKAWLSVEPVVKVQRGEGIDMWMYDFVFHEMNGVGMTVDRFAAYIFVGNAVHPQVLSGDSLEASGLERTIAPYGDWTLSGGLPVQDKVSGIGMEINVTDDNGASLTFTDFIKLSA